MDKIQKDLVKYLEDYTGVNLGLKARSEINAALYAADRSRANRARTGGSTMTTSKEQAQAVVDDWCQEVEWFGDGTDALVRLIAAALDALKEAQGDVTGKCFRCGKRTVPLCDACRSTLDEMEQYG